MLLHVTHKLKFGQNADKHEHATRVSSASGRKGENEKKKRNNSFLNGD